MNYTTRRFIFSIATAPLVVIAYALLLIVLGGTPSMFLNAWACVAIGWVIGLPVGIAVANKVVK